MAHLFLEPGALVRLEAEPDWGIGQIQSIVEHRVTVHFEHAGKKLINTEQAELVPVSASAAKDEPTDGCQ